MNERPLRFAIAAMGTRFELALFAGRGDLRAAGDAAIEEIEVWHRRLSRFEPDSLVAHINREAFRVPVRLDRDTYELFEDAARVSRASAGAFDITIGSGALIADPARWTVRASRADVSVDLGGIGKGHALDCAARVLRNAGVTSALLHGGTSSVVGIGVPEDTAAWRVAVDAGPEARVVMLRDSAMSVSDAAGPREARFDRPHILDPRNGQPASPARRVIVTGPSARLADAWSTALTVLGRVPPRFPAGFSAFIGTYEAALA